MDRLATLSAFVAVAEERGFASAARRLGLSASAVTRLVASLEERIGVRLLQRTTRAVSLTDAGNRYFERAQRILADLEAADGLAQAEQARATVGRLVISAPRTFGRLHVGPVMSAYLRRYTDVVGELRLNDHMAHLIEDGIDLAVRIGKLADSSLIARPVGLTRRVVVASPRYLQRMGEPKDPHELNAHKIIHFMGFDGSLDWRLIRAGRQERQSVSAQFTTNSADAAITHALADGGLAMVLAYQAAEELRRGRLNIVLRDFEPAPLPIQLVYPTARLLSARVRAFVYLATETADWRFTDFES